MANIEPNADVLIEISYIEMLQQREGEYTFDFPMVVAPRYIPGRAIGSLAHAARAGAALPNELERREGGGGLILLGPATFQRQKIEMLGEIAQGNVNFHKSSLGPAPYLQRIIDASTSILPPDDGAYRQREDVQALYRANPSYDFDVLYADGLVEFGQIAGDGLGHIAGRWFYFDPSILSVIQREEASDAAAFAADTNQVPDASRITPMPVRPPTRAGHDISLTVRIDTGVGGPAIIDWKSDLHEIICTDPPTYRDLGNKITLALKNQSEIPNRDFVLRWRCIDDSVREAVFTHADAKWIDAGDDKGAGNGGGGGFFTAVIAPPAKVAPETILPRELIFVLDTSGSMQGLPIEKAKAVMAKAIDAMRTGDTFNLITFSGDTRILWKAPRPNTEANRAEAQAFLTAQAGNGGTEMMTAINAALTQTPVDEAKAQTLTPADLANMPADGREVFVRTRFDDIEAEVRKSAVMQPVLRVRPDLTLKTTSFHFPVEQMGGNPLVELRGKWSTINGERTLEVANASRVDETRKEIEPLRIVMFLTDGQVGNDDAIISAVRENVRTTRVFSFGIGDSPNRYLLSGIAQAGRGEATYVNLNNDPDAAVQAFARRIESPVLRDIQVAFSEGLEVFDLMPALDAIPDLWDVKPLIVHGRYSCDKPRNGKISITGKTAAGDYARVIDIALPAREEGHAMLPALWARARIDDVLARDDSIRRQGVVEYATDESKKQVIALGERYGITSAFTSFVAIEKARITIAGQPMLVPIPIEFPSGMNWEGVFGGDATHRPADDLTLQLLGQAAKLEHPHAVQLLALDEARRNEAVSVEAAEQARAALVTELEKSNPSLALQTLVDYGNGQWKNPGTTRDAERKSAADVAGAPELDLEDALDQGALHYRFAEQNSGLAASDSFRLAVDYAQLQARLGEIDPASVTRLGIGAGLKHQGLATEQPDIATLRLAAGAFAPTPDGRVFVQPNPTTVEFAWQAAVNPPPPPPPPAPGGTGGGFGGGGGAGGGGSIFGEAGDDPQRLVTPEEAQSHLLDIVKETINPDGWNDFGGDLAEATIDNGVLNFRTLKDTPEAHTTVDRARGFVGMLVATIPEVAAIAKVDAPPSKPFDPATDVVDTAYKADPENVAAAGADTDEPPQLLLYVYDVRDLIAETAKASQASEDDATQRLMYLITELIAPECWLVNGGDRGRVQALKGNLIITIEPARHREIEDLLSKIRAALAARTPGAKPVEGNVFKGDDAAAAPANKPVADSPCMLVYDIRTHAATISAARNPPLPRGDALQLVFDAIQENVDPDGWRDVGGETGSIHEIADLLLIQTLPRHHRAIEGLLAGWQIEPERRKADPEVKSPAAKAAEDKQARREAEATIAVLQREDRLRRVIDERLWPLTIHAPQDAPAAAASIVILLKDVRDQAAIDRLKSLGMRIDDTNAGLNLVAGAIADARRVVDVALLDFVRRIEPIQAP